MTVLAVDTNILLDVLIPNSDFVQASLDCLLQAGETSRLIVCETVFAELSTQFPSVFTLRHFLDETGITLCPSSTAVLFSAGQAWKTYHGRTSRSKITCSKCGSKLNSSCSSCGYEVQVRQHMVADFMIGAHALVAADGLITRDRGFYRGYFEDLRLIVPGGQ